MFIVGGAFAGLDKVIEARVGKKSLGFTSPLSAETDNTNPGDIFSQVMPEDLVKFGLIPEFIGRLPIIASVTALDEPALIKVLTEPRNALIRQYQRLFELDEVQLAFEPEALSAIAQLAMARGTGARGLRSILEEVLLPAMYEIPGRDDIEKVVVTENTVKNGDHPTMILHQSKKEAPKARKDKSA